MTQGVVGQSTIQGLKAIFVSSSVTKVWEKSYILNLYKGEGVAMDRGIYRHLKLTDQVMKVVEHV